MHGLVCWILRKGLWPFHFEEFLLGASDWVELGRMLSCFSANIKIEADDPASDVSPRGLFF